MSMELKQAACAVVDTYHRVEVLDDEASKLLVVVEQILSEGGVRFYASVYDGDIGAQLAWTSDGDNQPYQLIGGYYMPGLFGVSSTLPWRECDQSIRVKLGKLVPALLTKLKKELDKVRKSSLQGM